MKYREVRLKVAIRYLQRFGGELTGYGYGGKLSISGWIGNPPVKVIPYIPTVLVVLENKYGLSLAVVTETPSETGYLYTKTGEFQLELPI